MDSVIPALPDVRCSARFRAGPASEKRPFRMTKKRRKLNVYGAEAGTPMGDEAAAVMGVPEAG
jgi:hypothetical protein